MVEGGLTEDRQAWLNSTGPGPKNPAVVACFTEAAARAAADNLNRTMRHNRAARFSYTAKELPL
jgi:hypothetical protein